MYGDQFGEFVCGYWGLKSQGVLGGLINRGAYKKKKKSSSKQTLAVLIEIRFACTVFLKLHFKSL